MNKAKLYYTAPTNQIFENVKHACIEIWKTYDDTHGYQTEKISRIKDLPNIRDNLMYMVAMFDHANQRRLASLLDSDSKRAISKRMVDGGTPIFLNPFYEEKKKNN